MTTTATTKNWLHTIGRGGGLDGFDVFQLVGGEVFDTFDQALMRFLLSNIFCRGQDILLGDFGVLELVIFFQLTLEGVVNLGQILDGRHFGLTTNKNNNVNFVNISKIFIRLHLRKGVNMSWFDTSTQIQVAADSEFQSNKAEEMQNSR